MRGKGIMAISIEKINKFTQRNKCNWNDFSDKQPQSLSV